MLTHQPLLLTLTAASGIAIATISAAPATGHNHDDPQSELFSRGIAPSREAASVEPSGRVELALEEPVLATPYLAENAPMYQGHPYYPAGNGHHYIPQETLPGQTRGRVTVHSILQAIQDGHPNVRPVYEPRLSDDYVDARELRQHHQNERMERLLQEVNDAQFNRQIGHEVDTVDSHQEVIDLEHPGYRSDSEQLTRRALGPTREAAAPVREAPENVEHNGRTNVWLRVDRLTAEDLQNVGYDIPPMDPISPARYSTRLLLHELEREANHRERMMIRPNRGNINQFLRANGRQHVMEGGEASYRNPHAEAVQRERMARNEVEAVRIAAEEMPVAAAEVIDVDYPGYETE